MHQHLLRIQQKEKFTKLRSSTQRHKGCRKSLSAGAHYSFCRHGWLLASQICLQLHGARRPGHWPLISLLKRIKILLPRTARPGRPVCVHRICRLFSDTPACQLTAVPSPCCHQGLLKLRPNDKFAETAALMKNKWIPQNKEKLNFVH